MPEITSVNKASNNEWDEMWLRSEYSTYYHSREWAEIWQSYTNGVIRPLTQKISFSDGKNVIVPIMRQNYYGGIIKRYGLVGPPSEAKAQYGNWLSDNPLTAEHIVLLVNYLITKYKNLVWMLNPFDENSKRLAVDSKYIRRKPFVSYMIDLTKGQDNIYSNFKQNCRNKINQGIKNKLMVKEGAERQDWLNYYRIYQDTVTRWRDKALYVLDWKFFEILYEKHSKHRTLWLTWYNNIPISGCICFYSNKIILLFHSASLSEYQYLRPVNLEKYIVIKDGVDKGYHWLDLGTAGGNKGLDNFKKSFGPEKKMRDMIISWHPVIYNIKKVIERK